jgi:tetratricopeptide (TPR) repeat protein
LTKRVSADTGGFFANRNVTLATIILLAIAARVLFMILFSRSLLRDAIWSDAATYDNWARNIVASHDWIGREPFFMTPLYPYFLAVVYSVFGRSLLAVRVIQSAAGVGIAVLLFLLGEKLFSSRKAGFVAGLCGALYGPFLLSNNLLLVETIKTLLLTLALWILLLATQKRRPIWWFAGGLLVGLSILARPSDLIVCAGVAVWILWFAEGTRGEKFKQLGTFAAAIVLIIAPVTLRNYLVSGETIIITSNGGLNFYVGNNPRAVGIYYNVEQIDLVNDPDGRLHLEDLSGRPLSHSEASSLWMTRSLDFVLGQPFDFVSLLGRKLLLFFHHKEISQLGYNYSFIEQTSIPILAYFPSFLIVGSLGLMGCVLAWSRWKQNFLLYAFLAAQVLGTTLFFVTDRFRLSAIPMLMLFAGFGVVEVIDGIKKKERKIVLTGAIALAGATLLTTVFNLEIPDDFSLEWENVGLMKFGAKDVDGALTAYQESMRYSDSFHIRNNIGNVLLAKGKADDALAQYRVGYSMNPRQPISSFSMGMAFVSRQDWPSALQAFEKAIEINPQFAPAHLNKGLTLYYMQRFQEALASLRRYTELEHDQSRLASVNLDIRNLEHLLESREPNPPSH